MSESESFHVTHSRFSLMCSGLGERGMTTMPRCTVHRSTTAVGERPTESAISFTTALFSIITELPLPYLQKGHTQIAGGDDAVTRHRELLGPTCRERESLLSAVFAGQASSCIITCTYTHTHTHTHTREPQPYQSLRIIITPQRRTHPVSTTPSSLATRCSSGEEKRGWSSSWFTAGNTVAYLLM
jgi:hypothetical protein